MLLNPTAPLLDTTRAWLFGSTPQFLGLCFLSCAVTVLAFVAGWLVYRLALPIVMERVIT
jgi:lipopolysaccharide transport system permease protein